MSKREKVTVEERIEAARACVEGRISQAEAARRLGVDEKTIERWVARYRAAGPQAFKSLEHNHIYSPELKQQAVEDYLAGKGSQNEMSAKYGLRSDSQLYSWIKWYNSGKDFGHRMSGGSRMKEGRETTFEERLDIVKDCIKHGQNYVETAIKYNVSYQQVYTWVKKFRELGEKGLQDRRGKRTVSQEPRNELEEAKIRIAQLEHQLYLTQVERDLLKKLDELERRDAFRK